MTDWRVSSSDTALTRRQLRETSSARRPGRFLKVGGRVALVAAVALATWVIPATGVVLPEVETEVEAAPALADASVLDVLGTTHSHHDVVPEAGALQHDPRAQGRAMLTVSRDVSERSATACDAPRTEANGTLAAHVVPHEITLVMPLLEGTYRLTSQYGYRVHPIFGRYSMHTGLDLAARTGTPIHAIADGVVTHAGGGRDGRSGQLIIIEHELDGERVWSWYVHMYPNGVYVSEGQQVSAGQVIGAVGSYGYSTGPHLHLEIHVDEDLTTVDPRTWLAANEAVALDSETIACTQGG